MIQKNKLIFEKNWEIMKNKPGLTDVGNPDQVSLNLGGYPMQVRWNYIIEIIDQIRKMEIEQSDLKE